MFSFAELPWAGVTEMQIVPRIQQRAKLPKPSPCPDAVYDMMLACWKLDRTLRCTAQQLLSMLTTHMGTRGLDLLSLTWPDTDGAVAGNDDVIVDMSSAEAHARFADLEIDPHTLVTVRQLGQGEYGSVVMAQWQRTPARRVDVAVKYLHDEAPEAQQQFAYEAKLLSSLSHHSIVRVLGVCFQSAPHCIVLELMPNGDLQGYLDRHASELVKQSGALVGVCCQVAEAVAYLADRNVVHRDLAAR